jgi:hypothetical protein
VTLDAALSVNRHVSDEIRSYAYNIQYSIAAQQTAADTDNRKDKWQTAMSSLS